MKPLSAWWIVLLVGLLIGLPVAIRRRRALCAYWDRACAGRDWRRAFPEVAKDDIRRYLQLFVDAFAFHGSRSLKFRPSDKIIDIYRAIYPEKGLADILELETFAMRVGQAYHLDLTKEWNPEITLGEVFRMTRVIGMLKTS